MTSWGHQKQTCSSNHPSQKHGPNPSSLTLLHHYVFKTLLKPTSLLSSIMNADIQQVKKTLNMIKAMEKKLKKYLK
jgi:hypothetical protein